MKIKINIRQHEVLVQILTELRFEPKDFKFLDGIKQTIYFEINSQKVDELRDRIEEELQKSGFDFNYKLNGRGEILQELSDILLV